MNYLDANASALPLPTESIQQSSGNPSSAHRAGQMARARIENARETIAALMGTAAGRLVFTSGGSESVATALWAGPESFRTIYHCATDHPVTRKCAALLRKRCGRNTVHIAIDKHARPNPEAISGPAIVTLQIAHSELGTVLTPQWIEKIAGTPGNRGNLLLHLDGCQALGKIDLRPYLDLADLASFSGHKIGAPTGIGLLYVREGLGELDPLIPGEQEWRRRGGTENIFGIESLASVAAQRLTAAHIREQNIRWITLTNHLRARLADTSPDVQILSPAISDGCLSQTTFLRIPGLQSNVAVIAFDKRGIAVSAGTACRSGLVEANETALALGLSQQQAAETLRVSLDWSTSLDQIDAFVEALTAIRRALTR